MAWSTLIPKYDSSNPNNGGFMAGVEIEVMVRYEWHGSPYKDYTVKVYSPFDMVVQEHANGGRGSVTSNQLFTDGVTSPSEFTGNPFDLGDMIPSWYLPNCLN